MMMRWPKFSKIIIQCLDQYKLISRWFGPDWKARSIGFGDYLLPRQKTFLGEKGTTKKKKEKIRSAQPIPRYLYTRPSNRRDRPIVLREVDATMLLRSIYLYSFIFYCCCWDQETQERLWKKERRDGDPRVFLYMYLRVVPHASSPRCSTGWRWLGAQYPKVLCPCKDESALDHWSKSGTQQQQQHTFFFCVVVVGGRGDKLLCVRNNSRRNWKDDGEQKKGEKMKMKNVNARLRATGEHHSILLLKTKQKEKSIRFFVVVVFFIPLWLWSCVDRVRISSLPWPSTLGLITSTLLFLSFPSQKVNYTSSPALNSVSHHRHCV